MAETLFAAAASSWAVLMGIAPVLQIRVASQPWCK